MPRTDIRISRGRESGADQSAEQPDPEACDLQLRFGTAVRIAGQHFERADLFAGQAWDMRGHVIAPRRARCEPVISPGLNRVVSADDWRERGA
jgi:hypothetical protein